MNHNIILIIVAVFSLAIRVGANAFLYNTRIPFGGVVLYLRCEKAARMNAPRLVKVINF
jgi:hypothetical protein